MINVSKYCCTNYKSINCSSLSLIYEQILQVGDAFVSTFSNLRASPDPHYISFLSELTRSRCNCTVAVLLLHVPPLLDPWPLKLRFCLDHRNYCLGRFSARAGERTCQARTFSQCRRRRVRYTLPCCARASTASCKGGIVRARTLLLNGTQPFAVVDR
jgi:hypothetical protein